MLVSWKYIQKRRGWTVELVFDSLSEKTWEGFCSFFSERDIECPPREEFDALLKSRQPKTPAPPEKTVKSQAKRRVKSTSRTKRKPTNAKKK